MSMENVLPDAPIELPQGRFEGPTVRSLFATVLLKTGLWVSALLLSRSMTGQARAAS